jgi:hypothetical protein
MLEKIEGTIKNGQSRKTGYIRSTGYKRKINKQKHNTIFVRHHYAQANTNKVNMTWALLQTTGGKDEPDIVFIRHNNVIRYSKLLDLTIRKHTNINLNIIVQYLLYWFINVINVTLVHCLYLLQHNMLWYWPDIIELVTLTSDVSRPNRTDVKITLAEVPSCFRILLAVLSVTKIYDFTSYYI